MRLLERANLAFLPAIRLFGTEQFDFHPIRRDRGRIDDDEWAARASRSRVDGAGGQFLAGACRADDQDAAVGRRDLLDGLAQLDHGGRGADQRARQRG